MSKKQNIFLIVLMAVTGVFMCILLFDGPPSVLKSSPESEQSEEGQNLAQSNDKQSNVLNIEVSVTEQEFKVLQDWTINYEVKHPNLNIQLTNVSDEESYQHFKKAAQLGESADIMLMDNNWIAEFAALGYLQALDAIYSSDQQSEIHTGIMNQMKWNWYIWCIPKDMNPYIVAWNPEVLLQQGRIELPTTAQDWIAAIQSNHRPEEGKTGLYMNPSDPGALISILWGAGGYWLDLKSGDESQGALQSTANRLQQLLFSPLNMGNRSSKTLAETMPYPNDTFQPWDKLKTGEIAFYLTDYASYYLQSAEDIKFTALPHFVDAESENAPSLLKGRAFVIASASDMQEEAVEWIVEMTSAERQLEMMSSSGWLPANMNRYFNEGIDESPNHQVLLNAVLAGRVLPFDPKLNQKLEKLKALQQQLWQGELTVTQFLEHIQANWHLSS